MDFALESYAKPALSPEEKRERELEQSRLRVKAHRERKKQEKLAIAGAQETLEPTIGTVEDQNIVLP